MSWSVYVLRCADNSLYTGVSSCVDERIEQHNSSKLGAKYTRSRRPVQEVYRREFDTKSDAFKEEYRIKQLSKVKKEELIK